MENVMHNVVFKSDQKSNEHREVGNCQFKKKNYFEALISYNKSITYANSKETLSLGYGNRSAVYFELERYEECLKNIKWARENNFPKDKISRLDLREERCKKLMQQPKKNNEDPWEFFKLSYPGNEKVPWVADCVEVRTTEKYGRGIYATKDLKAGDIICIEEPVINIFSGNTVYRHCYNCFKTKMMNLIPCAITASFMFCSTECMDNFYSKFEDMNLALKDNVKILTIIAASFGGYKELDKFINKTDPEDLKKTIFDYDFSNPNHPDYHRNLMICFLSLSTTVKKDNMGLDYNKFVSKKAADHISALANTNLSANGYGCGELRLPFIDGFNILLFASLINHSCISNVSFVYIDNKVATIAVKPIKKGEQIVFCYHDKHHPHHQANKVRMEIKHKFKCDCQECIKQNYRFRIFMQPLPPMFMNRNDFTKGKELLKKGWEEINENTKTKEQIADILFVTLNIMYALAYYVTFPN